MHIFSPSIAIRTERIFSTVVTEDPPNHCIVGSYVHCSTLLFRYRSCRGYSIRLSLSFGPNPYVLALYVRGVVNNPYRRTSCIKHRKSAIKDAVTFITETNDSGIAAQGGCVSHLGTNRYNDTKQGVVQLLSTVEAERAAVQAS